MELNDVYDAAGNLTGQVVTRGTPLAAEQYYLAVQVWIRNESGDYLIQQRALDHVSGAGMWATTAGYVWSGEESRAGALREVHEELGIQLLPGDLQHFMRLKTDYRIEDVWIAGVTKAALTAPVLSAEVAAWTWATKSEIRQMISRGEFFAYSYFATLPE